MKKSIISIIKNDGFIAIYRDGRFYHVDGKREIAAKDLRLLKDELEKRRTQGAKDE